ncbi:MAG: citrate synthase [Candidatus Latescibacterota bacterium]
MAETARLELPGQTIEMPVVVGTEAERAIDISALRAQTGYITLDDGYRNTGACCSRVSFIDGERGVLRYRGIPIEELAERSNFLETAYLIIWGKLPDVQAFDTFCHLVRENMMLHEEMRHQFGAFPPAAPPMAILSAMINSLSCFYPNLLQVEDEDTLQQVAAQLLGKVGTLAAFAHKFSVGEPAVYPRPDVDYCANFMHMMFSRPYEEYHADPELTRALDLLLLLHAEHEQNCSTSTVRMVGSSGASLTASVAAGVCALWGPAHGGANVAVMEQLQQIRSEGISISQFLARVKRHEVRLMGFGHAVYRNFDPRARMVKEACDRVLAVLRRQDDLLELAKELEARALADDYFVQRKLYPNVDFYSGVILRALGIPQSMFTVLFAIGRMPGWIAHWREVHFDPELRIYRPRQIYVGPGKGHYSSLEERTGTPAADQPLCAPERDLGAPAAPR